MRFKPRPLSAHATRVLRAIVTLSRAERRAVGLDEALGRDPTASDYNSVHVLADRWLIVIDGPRIRPRQDGVRLLAQPFYRDRGK